MDEIPSVAAVFDHKADGERAGASPNGSIQQDFPLAGGVTGFAGGQLTYVGDRLGGFTYGVTQPREVYPAYVQGDVRSGVRFNG